MKNVIATLLIIASSLLAYEVELDVIGTVSIPDGIVDTRFADEFADFYNDYAFEEIFKVVVENIGEAEYSATGDNVIALYNFYTATSFNTDLYIRDEDVGVLGRYYTDSNVVAINARKLHALTREQLLYVLLHEVTHDVQYEEGRMDVESPSEIIINEIFADYSAVIGTISLTGLGIGSAIRVRQTPSMLSRYASPRSRATAKILIDYILLEQHYLLFIGELE